MKLTTSLDYQGLRESITLKAREHWRSYTLLRNETVIRTAISRHFALTGRLLEDKLIGRSLRPRERHVFIIADVVEDIIVCAVHGIETARVSGWCGATAVSISSGTSR